jgi:hypothetical protein
MVVLLNMPGPRLYTSTPACPAPGPCPSAAPPSPLQHATHRAQQVAVQLRRRLQLLRLRGHAVKVGHQRQQPGVDQDQGLAALRILLGSSDEALQGQGERGGGEGEQGEAQRRRVST